MSSKGFILALLATSVIVSGCSDISQENSSDLETINLESAQLVQIFGEEDISKNQLQSIPEGINESKVLDWKKIEVKSSRSNKELNYSIYEFENESLARNQIDSYSDTILRRGTSPTIGTEFNGFEVHDDRGNYKIFEKYNRNGKFVFGVSIRSSEYETEEAKNLNSFLDAQISNITESDRFYANPETLSLSLSQMPVSEDSIGTDYRSVGSVHRYQGDEGWNLTSDNILEVSESTFSLRSEGNTSNEPALILSSVKLYETEKAAEDHQAEFINSIRENATSYEEFERYGNATKLTFVPNTGFRNVIILGSTKNLNYYVITAGNNDYFPEVTEKLFLQIYSQVIEN